MDIFWVTLFDCFDWRRLVQRDKDRILVTDLSVLSRSEESLGLLEDDSDHELETTSDSICIDLTSTEEDLLVLVPELSGDEALQSATSSKMV